MATQLIMTVGTNALPVWVAWYHLKDQLEQPVKVRLIHTPGTKDEKDRLKIYCRDANFLDSISTSPGNPEKVHDDVQVVIDTLEEFTHLHVHYTGGTKVMSVETVASLEYGLSEENVEYYTTYLDPRGDEGPIIVDSYGNTYGPPDARNGVLVKLGKIAKLNGFELGEFEHQYHIGGKNYDIEVCPAPGIPTPEQLEAGQIVLDAVCDQDVRRNFQHIFSYQDSDWNPTFTSQDGEFIYPDDAGMFTLPNDANPIWQSDLLPELNKVYLKCQWDTTVGTLQYNGNHTATAAQKMDLKHLHKFFNGIWLEYAAYGAFEKALKKICEENLVRSNYQLFHSVHVRRANAMDLKVRPFELDVVAVLGYQIVVVSCTFSGYPNTIKQKGIEAYHRAKQLGGDEARAIVLCSANPQYQSFIQDELQDETGSTGTPLQVWGTDRWYDLSNDFYNYLRDDLHWK